MSSLSDIVNSHRPSPDRYVKIYEGLHSHPELSHQEEKTAATVAAELKDLLKDHDGKVTTGIGGHGLVGVIKNGDGPIVGLRADMDALPIEEKTGAPYASKATMKDANGTMQPVTHACGHDLHTSALLAATKLLISAKEKWAGTLILIFQPAEEVGEGAQAMIDDGLYTKNIIPVPDVVIGGHVTQQRAGSIGVKPGIMSTASDTFKITVHGMGSHGSQPQNSIDPITITAYIITRLQTLVSRETAPQDAAVLTVGTIHGGTAPNSIPDRAEFTINMRTYDPIVRDRLLAGVKRIVKAECEAGSSPEPPEFTVLTSFPLLQNDEDVTARLSKSMSEHFGESFAKYGPLSASEDFGRLAMAVDKPYCFFAYGGTDQAFWDDKERQGRVKEEVPVNHSPYFLPALQPTFQVAMDAYALAALTWMAKGTG